METAWNLIDRSDPKIEKLVGTITFNREENTVDVETDDDDVKAFIDEIADQLDKVKVDLESYESVFLNIIPQLSDDLLVAVPIENKEELKQVPEVKQETKYRVRRI